jgi:hypothetical protein
MKNTFLVSLVICAFSACPGEPVNPSADGGTTNSGGGTAMSGGGTTNTGGGTTNTGGGTTNTGGGTTTSGGGTATSGGGTAMSGGGNTNTGGGTMNSDAGTPQSDAGVDSGIRDAGILQDAGGPFFSLGNTSQPSDAGAAFRCDGGAICIQMRRYWPTVATGTMQVKDWGFVLAPDYQEQRDFRRQAFYSLFNSPANEFVLVDYFAHPAWPLALSEWMDTWHIRYDGNTVIEFKDDANLNTISDPRRPGVTFVRTPYSANEELRWGNVLQMGIVNNSPTHAFTTFFLVDAGTLTQGFPLGDGGFAPNGIGAHEGRGDNAFILSELRDNVIVNGRRYNQVAVVRVTQRICASPEPSGCAYTPSGTGAFFINDFYLAPDVGQIINIGSSAIRAPNGQLDFDGGAFHFSRDYIEIAKRVCVQPVRNPLPQYDWQVATNAGVTGGSDAPGPCP